MRKLEIYEPPLCCPTGVCGPAPDPALAELQENILRWKKEGIAPDVATEEYRERVIGPMRGVMPPDVMKVREMFSLFTEECGEQMANMVSMMGMMMGRKGGGCCG